MTLKPLTWAFIGFGILGVAVLGAFWHDHPGLGSEPATDAIAARPVTAPTVTPDAPPRVPDLRPVFALKDLAGNTHSITEWDGKSLIVNFWATWCAPCRREIPLLNQTAAKYRSNGFEIVGIAVDFAEDVKKYTAQVPLHYDLLIGEDDGLEAARGFGVQSLAFPFTAFVDAKGEVLAVHLGELHEPQINMIISTIMSVNDGKMSASEGRALIQRSLAKLTQTPVDSPSH
jgi:thiol-disulfide isomerase/thioredoxin